MPKELEDIIRLGQEHPKRYYNQIGKCFPIAEYAFNRLIEKCRKYPGKPKKCFLTRDTKNKCNYIGREIRVISRNKYGLGTKSYYLCLKK